MSVVDEVTRTPTLRPAYASSNIRTWIGFKQFMALAEAAVLDWFRQRGAGPGRLYHDHGVGLTVVDSSVQLPAVLDVDDAVVAEARLIGPGRFAVTLRAETDDRVVLKGKVRVALVTEHGAPEHRPLAADLDLMVADEVGRAAPPAPPGPGAIRWSWPARYFHCHFSDRVQHGSFVAAMEEAVDRYLAAVGLPVGRILDERGWIPVVSRARVTLTADAHMDEVVTTSFEVDEVLRRSAFDGTLRCWVDRDGAAVEVASGRILHGYAVSRGPGAGALAALDAATVAALTRGGS